MGQAEGRREADDVALGHGAGNDPGLEHIADDGRHHFARRIKLRAAIAVFDQFHGAEHAFAANIAHFGVIAQRRLHLGVEVTTHVRGILDQFQFIDQLEVRDPGSGPDGVRRIGPAVADGAVFIGALLQHFPHLVAHDRAGKRRIGRGQTLGNGDQVRLHPVVVRAEHRPQTAKAGDDLIRDQQNVVLVQHLLHSGPIAFGRRHDAPGAQNRLPDEGGDGVGTFAFDQRFQFAHQVRGELCFAHVCVGAAVVIGRVGVHHLCQRQVELLVEQLQPSQRARHQTRPMIATPARDDLFLLGAAKDVVVVPDQLDVGLIRVRATKAEIDLAHAFGRAVEDHLAERDARLGAVADVGVVIGQFMRLLGNRLGDLGPAVAHVHAVETGKSVEHLVAVAVGDMAAFGGFDHTGRAFAARVLRQMGGGVKEIFTVPLFEHIVLQHWSSLSIDAPLRRILKS